MSTIQYIFDNIVPILFGLLLFQLIASLLLLATSRRVFSTQKMLEYDLFGLVNKLEGLTATKREKMLKHYDQLLEQLENRLPAAVAANAGELIYETERSILTRLAELDKSLRTDEAERKKLDELIVTMESLEDTIVTTASDAVRKVISENRRALSEIDPDNFSH